MVPREWGPEAEGEKLGVERLGLSLSLPGCSQEEKLICKVTKRHLIVPPKAQIGPKCQLGKDSKWKWVLNGVCRQYERGGLLTFSAMLKYC